MTTTTSRADLPGLLKALEIVESHSNPAEAIHALIRETESLPPRPPRGWLVEFESYPTDDYPIQEIHFVEEAPEGHYLDCATALYAEDSVYEASILKAEVVQVIGQLLREIKRLDAQNPLPEKIVDYLIRKNLRGNPMRLGDC